MIRRVVAWFMAYFCDQSVRFECGCYCSRRSLHGRRLSLSVIRLKSLPLLITRSVRGVVFCCESVLLLSTRLLATSSTSRFVESARSTPLSSCLLPSTTPAIAGSALLIILAILLVLMGLVGVVSSFFFYLAGGDKLAAN